MKYLIILVGCMIMFGLTGYIIPKEEAKRGYDEVVIEGMTYVKFEGPDGSITVANITKDKLEVELLKKQIKNK